MARPGAPSLRMRDRYQRLTHRRTDVVAAVGALLVANVLALVPADPALRAVGVLLMAAAIPGALVLAQILPRDERTEPAERVVLAVGLGLALMLVGVLLLHYMPGRIPRSAVLILYNVLSLAAWVWRLAAPRGPSPGGPVGAHRVRLWPLSGITWAILGIVLLAAALRLTNLSYAEFQGDEVAVLHKAAAAIQGRDDALFFHKKGPAEILTVLAVYAGSGTINELAARLPFAMMSLAFIGVVYALARRLWSAGAGVWAALFVAINGFFLAFARIVQYQSSVLLFSGLALLTAERYRASRRQVDLWLTALFCVLGLWSHTDAAFGAIAAAVVILRALVVPGARPRGRAPAAGGTGRAWRGALLPARMEDGPALQHDRHDPRRSQ